MVKIDVSEIKSFKCRRKWQFTSRNRMHLTTYVPPKALALGTLFHEAVAMLYSGAKYEKVWALVEKQMSKDDIALKAMLRGYVEHVLPEDLERWKVLEVEYKFEFHSGLGREYYHCTSCGSVYDYSEREDCLDCDDGKIAHVDTRVMCIGAIDLIVYDSEANEVKGIEHKTCKNFREETFAKLDEQPRVYYEALEVYIVEAKQKGLVPQDAANGGIVINEVKKLLRDFQYKRIDCKYTKKERDIFWQHWLNQLTKCKEAIDADEHELPTPDFFACNMCEFKFVCAEQGYLLIDKEQILDEYGLEFKVRDRDHLEEKNKLAGEKAEA